MRNPVRLLHLFVLFASKWVEWHERKILRQGTPLSLAQQMDAAKMGVTFPEEIRLMKVEDIPVLNGWFVRCLSRVVPQVSPYTVGLSLRYGIYIRSRYWGNRHLIAHECVHTGQYERTGSVSAFLMQYFTECIEIGYPSAPLEQEAIMRSASLDH